MADEKKTEAPKPAPLTADQHSSGPATQTPAAAGSAEMVADEANKTETYYLRPNATHMVLVKGERITLNQAGQTAELTRAQYNGVSDKFDTADEYKARKTSDGADAADTLLPNPATMEQATIEGHQNATNEPAKGKASENPTGEVAKTASK